MSSLNLVAKSVFYGKMQTQNDNNRSLILEPLLTILVITVSHPCPLSPMDQRFLMQVKLNGRLFPVAEASSKKVAKKDAAAATLRILMKEMSGDSDTMEEENSATVLNQVADIAVSFSSFFLSVLLRMSRYVI